MVRPKSIAAKAAPTGAHKSGRSGFSRDGFVQPTFDPEQFDKRTDRTRFAQLPPGIILGRFFVGTVGGALAATSIAAKAPPTSNRVARMQSGIIGAPQKHRG